MKNVRVARRYAQALMSIADEQHSIDAIAADLEVIGAAIRGSRDLHLLIASPVIREGKKQAVFEELFGKHVGRVTRGFVTLLIQKHREVLLPEVVEQFSELRDEKQGILNVDVGGSTELSRAQEGDLVQRLEQHTGKKVRLHFAVDKAIKGGLVVRIGDTVLDASVRRQLERLRERFREGGPLTTTNA
jgi:F-type H+-transporting ATPase subunit delta